MQGRAKTDHIAAQTSSISLATRMLVVALSIGVAAGVLFYCLPELDLDISSVFYGPSRFVGATSLAVGACRLLAFLVFAGVGVFACVGLVISIRQGTWLGAAPSRWVFLVVCLAVGPGLIGNYALKNNWGRARPSQIVEFSGTKNYTLPLTPSDQCRRNCSFVSGEAANVFMAFFALAFVFLAHARVLIAFGIIGGCLAGLVRMSQGAHFVSDVVFAGVIMAAAAALLELLFSLSRSTLRSRGGAANGFLA